MKNERIIESRSAQRIVEGVRDELRGIRRRSENPDLLDRVALPLERRAVHKLARMLGIDPREAQ